MQKLINRIIFLFSNFLKLFQRHSVSVQGSRLGWLRLINYVA